VPSAHATCRGPRTVHCNPIVAYTTTNEYRVHTHTRPFNGHLSGTTQVGRYQKGKTKLDFSEAKDSEWQWHQLGHMQVCTSLQTDNHASTPPLSVLQAGCPSCRPTNSVKALKEHYQVALCNDISLQRGRFCARSLASCIPRSSEDSSS